MSIEEVYNNLPINIEKYNIKTINDLPLHSLIRLFVIIARNRNKLIQYDAYNTNHNRMREKIYVSSYIHQYNDNNLCTDPDWIFYILFIHNENDINKNYNFITLREINRILISKKKFDTINNIAYKYPIIHQIL